MLDHSVIQLTFKTYPGDEPLHRKDFVAAIQATPRPVALEMAVKFRSGIGEPLQNSTLNNSLPRVGWLHDLDGIVDGNPQPLFEHDWLEDGLEIRCFQSEASSANTESLVVGQTCHGDVVGFVWRGVQSELTLDLLLKHFHGLGHNFIVKPFLLAQPAPKILGEAHVEECGATKSS
ncbi:hypothetical protein HG531_006497 [Fusarium graminearum]|nr:hypothetical protein HG531_006497 [Fusarium graminearum]